MTAFLELLNIAPTVMSQDLSNTDMSKFQALQQKRTLAFVNHFVMTNVQFLNNFMKNCEQKLMAFERKLEKVNAAMVLLEARLSSIPELNIPQTPTEVKESPTNPAINPPSAAEKPNEPHPEETNPEDKTDNSSSKVTPEYDRFLKMVQVGVPIQAVKLKVSLEGLDPLVFEEILRK